MELRRLFVYNVALSAVVTLVGMMVAVDYNAGDVCGWFFGGFFGGSFYDFIKANLSS